MNYNEFAERIKAKYPDYKDMDNKELSERVIAKYPVYKEQVTFDNVQEQPKQTQATQPQPQIENQPEKPVNYTEGKPLEGGLTYDYTPEYSELYNDYKNNKISKEQLVDYSKQRLEQDYKEADKLKRNEAIRNWVGGGIVTAGNIPLLNMPVTGALGGSLVGMGEGILNHENAKDTTKRALGYGLTGLALGKLPKIGQFLGKTKVGQAVGNKVAEIGEKAIGALSDSKVGSKVLEGTEKLGNELIKERHLKPLPQKAQIAVNPLPEAKKTVSLRALKNEIKSNKFSDKKLMVTHNASRKGTFTQVLQNEDNAVINAERQFNDIIKEISNKPENVNNQEYLQDVENRIQKIINDSPYSNSEEFANSFWEKYAKTVDDAYKYNEAKAPKPQTNPEDYFGGEVENEPQWFEKFSKTEPDKNSSRLPITMRKKGTLPPELNDINPEYEVLHNADLKQQAQRAIEQNPDEALGGLKLKSSNKNDKLSALDFEQGRQILSQLYKEGRYNEAIDLIENLSKKASEAGQAVQALSLWSRTTPEGATRFAQKVIDDFNKTAKNKIKLTPEQVQDIEELAKKIQATQEGTRENQVATQLMMKYIKGLVPVSAGNRLRTLQNISLLLNLKTFGRNIGGNAIFAGMENAITKPLASVYDRIASLKTGQRTRVNPQLGEYFKGLGQGLKEGSEDVAMGINTRDNLGTRFNLNDVPSFEGVPVLDQLEKALNYSLQVPDRMFYQATYRESLANQMKAMGVTSPTPEMVERANQEALESVFQNNSKLGNMVLKFRQGGNELYNINGFGLGDAFIPYAQTPANVAQQGINYSPLGALNALGKDQRQATLDLARATVGTGLIGGGAYLADKGIINPAIEDYQTRKNYEATGLKPNTLNIGDYNVTYNQLQPLSAPIAGGVALNDIKNGDYQKVLDNTFNSIADLGMLQSANQFMSDMNDDGLGTALINLGASLPSRFIPTSVKQIRDLSDDYQRETYDPNKLKQGLNQMVNKIPVLDKTLPLKYDVMGQPVKTYQSKGLAGVYDKVANPVFVNKRVNDSTMQALLNLYERTGDKGALFPTVDRSVKFTDIKGEKVNRKLSGAELSEYQRELGTINKEILTNIINSPIYDNLDDEDRLNLISKVHRTVKAKVDEKLFNKPNEQTRKLIRKLTKEQKSDIIDKVIREYSSKYLPLQVEKVYREQI